VGLIAGILNCGGLAGFAQVNPGQPTSQPAAGVAAEGKPNGTEYYRRDPELMKRYFPGGLPANAPSEANSEQKFSIKFKGGSPDELVKALRQAMAASIRNPTGPNVVIASGMHNVLMPAFELENVTLNDVFQTLNSLSDSSKSGQWTLSGSTEPIWILNSINPNMGLIDPLTGLPLGANRPKEPRMCQVYPVAGYLSDVKIDDITTAIQTAWNLLPSSNEEPAGTLKFHKDTELLIALGTADQLRLVKDVLTSLRQGMMEKEHLARRPPAEKPESTNKNENTNSKGL